MADSLNRQYIRSINKIIEEMEISNTDPLTHYIHSLGPSQPNLSFTFRSIGMADLRKTLNSMKSTGLTGDDDISVKMLKTS